MSDIDYNSIRKDAVLFWEEVREMYYKINRDDIKDARPNRRFNEMIKLLVSSKIKSVKDSDFLSQSEEETKIITRDFFHELFNGKYDDEIKKYENFIQINHSLPKFDGAVAFDFDFPNKKRSLSKIQIYNMNSLYSSISLANQYMNGIQSIEPLELFHNYNYDGILPNLIELILASKLDKEKSGSILENAEALRMKNLSESAIEYLSCLTIFPDIDISDSISNSSLYIYKYSFFLSYKNLVSGIYANTLFDRYLTGPTYMIDQISDVIERKKIMPELLKEQNIIMGSNEVINTFKKTLIKVSK